MLLKMRIPETEDKNIKGCFKEMQTQINIALSEIEKRIEALEKEGDN